MDPIFESYKAITEAEKWNVFDFYDSHKHGKVAKEVTNQILKLIKGSKFGSNPKQLGKEISSIINDNGEIGANDTAAREAIVDYIEDKNGEGFAKKVWEQL